MLHLDPHGTSTDRLHNRELIWIIRGPVMKAIRTIDPGKLADSSQAVCESGGFFESP